MPATFDISELYLAFRQAKAALFFERRGVGSGQFAAYENDLLANLKRLKTVLSRGISFDNLDVGEVWIVPKRFHGGIDDNDKPTRIGLPSPLGGARPIDVQTRLSPTPDYAIAEILYLRRFGALLERTLSKNVVGYRLDLKDGLMPRHSRWLFEYWPKRYQKFRSAPLAAAKKILEGGSQALVLSADLANFYDTVDSAFLLTDDFSARLAQLGQANDDILEFTTVTRSLLSSYGRFHKVASQRLSVPVRIGVPIGALTSRVIANIALATLDQYIEARPGVVCYQRYVDDLVIVVRDEAPQTQQESIRKYLPIFPGSDDLVRLDVDALRRPGSQFQVQQQKVRVHHLGGEPGKDFVDAVTADFAKVLSERRSFIDASTLVGDGLTHLIRASNTEGSPLRVLREADRTRLERFALSTSLRSLERVTSMIEAEEARELVRASLERVGRVLDNEDNWVNDLDVSFRLLKLAIITGDWDSAKELCRRMDRVWSTTESLQQFVGVLYYKGQKLRPDKLRPWVWLRNYLHERRLEAVCACLPIGTGAVDVSSKFPDGLLVRTAEIKATSLKRRAELLALADLRARDREEDGFFGRPTMEEPSSPIRIALQSDSGLKERLLQIDKFVRRCWDLGDRAWVMPATRLFLCTRPPSYFDVSRRWLYQVEDNGFDKTTFEELTSLVNAVRGTQYSDHVGHVLNRETIFFEGAHLKQQQDIERPCDPRIILGNLVVDDAAWAGAATRRAGSTVGAPVLSKRRLRDLSRVLDKAERVSRENVASLLVLPELSLPRQWFRTLANHTVRSGRLGLVAGLEYFHHSSGPFVANQTVAVLPGPFMSAASWPWTKRLPAREEERLLSNLDTPVSFKPPSTDCPRRTVIHSDWGSFSVLICSEMIETKRVADLLGRVQLVLCPSWNQDTASYDHLIQSVGFQLHAIIAIANNGRYSDCRAWAPRTERWERDLCRLIERDVNDIVYVDIPVSSLLAFHGGEKQATDPYLRLRAALINRRYVEARRELDRLTDELPGSWRPLPPDWKR